MLTRRRVLCSVLLAIAAMNALALTVRASFFGSTITVPGIVRPAQQADLNFRIAGRLVRIDVRPGDHVHQGQVVAQLDDTVAKLSVVAAQAVRDADAAQVAQLEAPNLPAQQQILQDRLQQAAAAVDATNQLAAGAASYDNTLVALAGNALARVQANQAQDQAHYSAACPGGATAAPPTIAPGVGAQPPPGATPAPPTALQLDAWSQQMQIYALCSHLQDVVNQDAVATAAAADGVQRAQAEAARDSTSTSAAADVAQSNVAVAQAVISASTAPATPAQIAQAKAQVAKDDAQLALAQQDLTDVTLTAPTDGTVLSTSGTSGDLVSDAGVHNFATPDSQPVTQPSFQLLPAPQAPQQSTAPYTSLISLAPDHGFQVVAQVPEDQIVKVKTGSTVQVSFSAIPNSNASGSVAEIVPVPVQSQGAVYFNVVITLTSAPSTVLPGMSSSAAIGV